MLEPKKRTSYLVTDKRGILTCGLQLLKHKDIMVFKGKDEFGKYIFYHYGERIRLKTTEGLRKTTKRCLDY